MELSSLTQCLAAFVFGSVVGFLVQRSRFCNTAALRDAMLFKSYRNTKALLNGSLDASLADQLNAEARSFAECAARADFAEGVSAFVEKRPPSFTAE